MLLVGSLAYGRVTRSRVEEAAPPSRHIILKVKIACSQIMSRMLIPEQGHMITLHSANIMNRKLPTGPSFAFPWSSALFARQKAGERPEELGKKWT